MSTRKIRTAERDLQSKRRALLRLRSSALGEERELLATTEPGWEDAAANHATAAALHTLGENEVVQLTRIEAALARLRDGSYGRCVVCGDAIDPRRLRVVPEADRCAGCTNHH